MEGVNPYIELLKEELVTACAAIDSTLTMLRGLKEKDFESMRAIIRNKLHDDLGTDNVSGWDYTHTTISVTTLERLFKHGYSLNFGDKRVLNTLSKLSAFLDYSDWYVFIEKKKEQYQLTSIGLEEEIIRVIEKANDAEFRAYQALPHIDTSELLEYLTSSGSAFLRIYNVLFQHGKKQWTINNPGNPSGHKMSEKHLRIISVSSKEAIVKTYEYWYLRWFELPTGRYRHIYNEKNVQTWTLVFDQKKWKVSDTYYPSPKNSVHITHLIIASLSKRFRWLK